MKNLRRSKERWGNFGNGTRKSTLSQTMAVQLSSASVEWFTPSEILSRVHELGGQPDLDPASCEAANRRVRAKRFFGKQDDGLMHEWDADYLFCNPPYGRGGLAGRFAAKAIEEHRAGRVKEAVLLVHFRPETGWFKPLWDYWFIVPDRALQFVPADGRTVGRAKCAQALVYFGDRPERFVQVFGDLGRKFDPNWQ